MLKLSLRSGVLRAKKRRERISHALRTRVPQSTTNIQFVNHKLGETCATRLERLCPFSIESYIVTSQQSDMAIFGNKARNAHC